ncbi:neuroligin-3-like [Lineus longissimus]|uniref:neuroligin-3-like n=1 Tax=Lineus longissimus TaxID=88925 RepID=UPI002B4E5D7A
MYNILTLGILLSFGSFGKMDFIRTKTPLGILEGYRRVENYDIPGKQTDAVDVFLGVPYARSPTGARRFMDPVPIDPWPGIRHANHFPPMCVQSNVNAWFTDVVGVPKFRMSEDCLYLNIYAPYEPEATHPVMVYFHGGSNKIGSGNYFDGTVLAMMGVVVVVPNFRLGPLGFLTTGDDAIPGNAGFMDQILALKWIKENIRALGGDPDKVTIFGNSAGGWDISVHLVSPYSKGLFHGAIIQSGSGLSDLARTSNKDVTSSFWHLARRFRCVKGAVRMTVRCLQHVQATHLLSETLDHYSVYPDGRVLSDEFADMLKDGIDTNVSVIIGVTSSEWARFFLQDPVDYLKKQGSARNVVKAKSPDMPHICLDLVAHLYSHWEDVNNSTVQGDMLLQVNADRYIIYPSLRLAELLHHSGSKTFFYLFDHSIPVNLPSLKKYRWLSDKSYHESELPFVFGAPFSGARMASVWHDGSYTNLDRNISHTMMTMWANFAKTRNPTPHPSVKWNLFHPETSAYLHISRQGTKMSAYLRAEQVSFWSRVFPKLCQGGNGSDFILGPTCPQTPSISIPDSGCPQPLYAEALWTVIGTFTFCILIVFLIILSKCSLFRKGLSKSLMSGS